MAEYKIQERVYNKETGEWDKTFPRTTADQVIESESKKFVTTEEKNQIAQALPLSGGTMTGVLSLSNDPEKDLDAATKAYVDRTTQTAVESLTANQIPELDAGKITTGKIDIERLPAGALERCVIVKDDAARFALTSSQVQKGDTVKVTDSGKMYFVTDDTKLDSEAGYEVYGAGTAASVPWAGVTDKPAAFPAEKHMHVASDLTTDESHQFVSTEEKSKIDAALPKSGGIMTGSLVLSADPTLDKEAATKKYVDDTARTAAAAIVDGSPEALDTLKELSAALGDDPNFATTIATELGKKLNADEVVTIAAAGKVLRLNADGQLEANVKGKAETAGKLATPVKINGVDFTGDTNIEITKVGDADIATMDKVSFPVISKDEPANKAAIWFELLG